MTTGQEGGFYGWPWSYYGDHVDERVHPPRPDLVERAIVPDYALSSHVAALGLAFTNGSAMPEAYANGAFIGEHGSWDRNFRSEEPTTALQSLMRNSYAVFCLK